MMPVSSVTSSIVTPCGSSSAGTSLRRPPAAMTTSASSTVPSSSSTPTTRGGPPSPASPAVGTVRTPDTGVPWSSSTSPSASATRRSTHSNVVRRTARPTRSSSPSSGSMTMPSGGMSRNRISVAPASISWASTSGCRSRSRFRRRARKAWECRTCGAPWRSQSKAPCGSAGSGVSSRSTMVTWWPARAAQRAVPSPPTPAPMTTIRATCPSCSDCWPPGASSMSMPARQAWSDVGRRT